jgi:hypothetical protein
MRKSVVHNDPLGNRDQNRSVSVTVTVRVRF